jgi:hypothetical protein
MMDLIMEAFPREDSQPRQNLKRTARMELSPDRDERRLKVKMNWNALWETINN